MEERLRVYFIGKIDVKSGNRKEGVLTVAAEVVDSIGEESMLRIGVAFCSPDDRFIKSEGRKTAIQRMKSEYTELIPFSGNSADDIAPFINKTRRFHVGMPVATANEDDSYKNGVTKPSVWRKRVLVRPSGMGLTYLYQGRAK